MCTSKVSMYKSNLNKALIFFLIFLGRFEVVEIVCYEGMELARGQVSLNSSQYEEFRNGHFLHEFGMHCIQAHYKVGVKLSETLAKQQAVNDC